MLSSSLIVLLAASSFVNGLPSLFRREVHDVASVPGLGALANIPRADAVVAPLGNVLGRKIKRDVTTLKGSPPPRATPTPVALGTQTVKGAPPTLATPTPVALGTQTVKGETDAFGTAAPSASAVNVTLTEPVPDAQTTDTPSTFVDAPAQDPVSVDQGLDGFSG